MTTKESTVDKFLQSVCRFVSTEERAQDIKDELKDHIESYICEYTNDGFSIEEATSKALMQMGNPDTLSTDFKDKVSNKNRIFTISLFLFFITSLSSMTIYAYINNTYSIIDLLVNMAIFVLYLPLIFGTIKAYKKSKTLSKKEPIFHIQSYKEPNWYESVLKPTKWFFILSIIFLVLGFLVDFKDIPKNELLKETLDMMHVLNLYVISIVMFSCLSPKKQNNIVYDEGILTFENFIPWDNISAYRWTKEHSKNKVINSIELKFKSGRSYTQRIIKVSSYQMNLVDEVFKSNNIEKRQFL
ncbi:permease prefix domain 1-containing protein [Romboutsia lituseburensis]|uniref:permease prefix domain 1-containing protein n=1 Tax=Romboutsia lituseburensis TaxID=1537 RepID=UPI00215A5C17|nr:permease prefix domain 1-containing protein [Romboutsia lituseburensis]MCR8746861.1 permease prefix domain 1-containing protein [Romboutsia lituseburensis]